MVKYFEEGIRTWRKRLVYAVYVYRFVTKYLGFSRRISNLLGYTGGESLEQIVIGFRGSCTARPVICSTRLGRQPVFSDRRQGIVAPFARVLKKFPARIIESLPIIGDRVLCPGWKRKVSHPVTP